MGVYFLSYDLCPSSRIDGVQTNIEDFLTSLEHVHFQKTGWLFEVEDPKPVLQRFMEITKDEDSFFITRVAQMGNVGGRVSVEVQEWLFARLPQA